MMEVTLMSWQVEGECKAGPFSFSVRQALNSSSEEMDGGREAIRV